MNTQNVIRVLHILGSLQRGGTESVVFNNYRFIDRSKIQFDIVVDNNSPCQIPEDIVKLGCKVYYISPYTHLTQYITEIRRLCKQNGYKIVHSHMNAMSVFSLLAAWQAGVPIRIAHSHSTASGGKDFKRDLFKYMLRPFSKVFANKYFACSEYAAQWLFGKRTINKGKVFLLNNAINVEQFKFDLWKRNESRHDMGLDGKFVVGHVGRFSPPKNHFFLIEIFNLICKEQSNSILLLVGGLGTAGTEIEERLQKKVDKLGLHDKVLFLGTKEDISNLYLAMDVFVLPSLYEGLGMASIEAQCSGLPCVLSDQVPEEAKVNKNVKFLSLNKSPEEWAEVILKSKDEKREDCSMKIAAAGYEIEIVAKKLEQQYLSYVSAENLFEKRKG